MNSYCSYNDPRWDRWIAYMCWLIMVVVIVCVAMAVEGCSTGRTISRTDTIRVSHERVSTDSVYVVHRDSTATNYRQGQWRIDPLTFTLSEHYLNAIRTALEQRSDGVREDASHSAMGGASRASTCGGYSVGSSACGSGSSAMGGYPHGNVSHGSAAVSGSSARGSSSVGSGYPLGSSNGNSVGGAAHASSHGSSSAHVSGSGNSVGMNSGWPFPPIIFLSRVDTLDMSAYSITSTSTHSRATAIDSTRSTTHAETIKEVNHLYWWQTLLMYIGGFFLLAVIARIVIRRLQII